jgi:hypothetical protein
MGLYTVSLPPRDVLYHEAGIEFFNDSKWWKTTSGGHVCQRGGVLILGNVGSSAHHFIDRQCGDLCWASLLLRYRADFSIRRSGLVHSGNDDLLVSQFLLHLAR